MSDRPGSRPGGSDAPPDFLERFAWHPEPELLGIRDAATSREALRAVGAATWDAALAYLYDHALVRAMGDFEDYASLRRRYFGPAERPAPAPADPLPLRDLIAEFSERVAPYTLSAYHPRSFSYFTPPPLISSVVGEVLGQFLQQGVDVWHAGPVGAFIEEEVVRWLCDLVGYPRTEGPPPDGATPEGPAGATDMGSFGILTSGGVMANFIAMTLVRDIHVPRARAAIGGDARVPRGAALEGLRVYASDQTHFSIGRALDELGFPTETLVVVPADDCFRLRGQAVASAIARDRDAGLTPVAIAAVAGSTNTGSVDAVGELADVAATEGLWLHVDAAYGAAARLSARDAGRVPDLDRADSVTVDPHKWFFQAYDIGGLVVRRGSDLETVFGGRRPEYYRGGDTPTSGNAVAAGSDPAETNDHHDDPGQLNFWKLGFEGTRRLRALKLWMSWKHLGTDGFGRLIEANDDLASHLARRCAESDDFEAVPAEPELSVVCFRHLPGGRATAAAMDPTALDDHQDRLQRDLERSGEGWLSTTRLRGATYLRAGIVNTQATEADIDGLLETLRRLGSTR